MRIPSASKDTYGRWETYALSLFISPEYILSCGKSWWTTSSNWRSEQVESLLQMTTSQKRNILVLAVQYTGCSCYVYIMQGLRVLYSRASIFESWCLTWPKMFKGFMCLPVIIMMDLPKCNLNCIIISIKLKLIFHQKASIYQYYLPVRNVVIPVQMPYMPVWML